MGVGAIIGTGIFVVIGEGAAIAGPAVTLSFVLAAVTCLFSALSYPELASSVPVSGSAYTYAYATLGELVAFIIGWDLILEYGVSCAAIAVGWGANLNAFLDSAFGIAIPEEFATSPSNGGTLNLPAVFVVLAVMLLLVRGTRESAFVNMIMVVVKLAVLVFFIVAAFTAFNADNFTPFAPEGTGTIVTAAGIIFFAYIGFDAVSTASEESNNPKRDLPLAIIGSLAVSTVVYVLVSIGAIGLAPISVLGESEAPLAAALEEGAGLSWAAAILALGAVVAITSVLLVIMYGQTRISSPCAATGSCRSGWRRCTRATGPRPDSRSSSASSSRCSPRWCRCRRSSSSSTSGRCSPSSWSTSASSCCAARARTCRGRSASRSRRGSR
jgi:APA family basic amino acid/polyamine antiporter